MQKRRRIRPTIPSSSLSSSSSSSSKKKGEGIKGKKRGNRKEEEEKIREMRKYPAVCIRVCAYWTGGWGDLFLLSPSLRRLRRRDLDGGGRWVVEEVKRRNGLQWPGLIRRWRSACAHRRPPPSPPRPPPRCLRATPQTPSFFVIFLIRQRPLCMFPLSFSLTRFPFLMGWIQPSLVGVGGRRRASEQLFFSLSVVSLSFSFLFPALFMLLSFFSNLFLACYSLAYFFCPSEEKKDSIMYFFFFLFCLVVVLFVSEMQSKLYTSSLAFQIQRRWLFRHFSSELNNYCELSWIIRNWGGGGEGGAAVIGCIGLEKLWLE